MAGGARDYLHGFSAEERARLRAQARFLEPSVFADVDFAGRRRLLEPGCGVGAETEILLERFPRLAVTGVDASASQLGAARRSLAPAIAAGRARLVLADALRLPLRDGAHDAAFICWLLEHVGAPVRILAEVRRCLAPGSPIHCIEVHNATLALEPACPATMRFWALLNARQRAIGGDPDAGASLAVNLGAAGFKDVRTYERRYHFDAARPREREDFVRYWDTLLMSAAPALLAASDVDARLIDEMRAELARVREVESGTFHYRWTGAAAKA